MTRQIKFTKGHGTGNDFVLVLDELGELNLSAKEIAKICDRHFGVGADGFIRVVRTKNVAEVKDQLDEAPEAQWFMDYYNADGSTAEDIYLGYANAYDYEEGITSRTFEQVNIQLNFADLDLDAVTRSHPDPEPAHLAGRVGEHLVAVVELDTEHPAREGLEDLALHLDLLFARDGELLSVGDAGGAGRGQ